MKLLLIKLGGSVITYKDSPTPKPRIDVIKRLVGEIKDIISWGNYKIILVHGAGSFAHGLVRKYNLQKGMKTQKQKRAFDLVADSMLKLNGIVMDYLFRTKISAVSIPPHTFITQSAGKITNFELNVIKKYLEGSQIPVLFGDVVLDKKWGCSVISGDKVVCFLAKKFKAQKVIFLSDVDGIYTSDPKKNPKAKLISEINNSNISKLLAGLSPSGRDDVTGEMLGKIQEIRKNLKGIPVLIADGLKPGALLRAVLASTQAQAGTKLLLH